MILCICWLLDFPKSFKELKNNDIKSEYKNMILKIS